MPPPPPKPKEQGQPPPQAAEEGTKDAARRSSSGFFPQLDYSPRQVRLKVQLTVAHTATPSSLVKPTIRYTFWGNRHETTPDLPVPAAAPGTVPGAAGPEGGKGGGRGAAAAKGGGGGGGEGAWKEVDVAEGRKGWQWEKTYEAMTADKDLALSINSSPHLLFTLADRAEGEVATALLPPPSPTATPAPPPPKAKASSSSANAVPVASLTPVGRNFLYQMLVDTSLLLLASSGAVSMTLDSTDPPATAASPPLPQGLTYLRVDISTSDHQPLLPSGLLHDLNPMLIHIRDARALPGLRFDTLPEQERFLVPDPYTVLNKHCQPVYAALVPSFDNLCTRPAQTSGRLNQSNVTWDFRTVYLTGHLDRLELEEKLENELLYIHLHDRDPVCVSHQDQVKRWEMAVAGGFPVDSTTGEFVNEGELPTMDASRLSRPPPLTVFEVDAKILTDWQARPLKARDKHPHGTVAVSLAGLMDQSQQLAWAFQRNQNPDPSNRSYCDERPRIKARFDVASQRSQRKPKGGAEMEEWNLTVEERLVRHEVGHYLDTGCTLGVHVELHRPLRTLQEGETQAKATGPATPCLPLFGRAAIMLEYGNSPFLREIMTAIDVVNKAALPGIVGSLRSYELSPEEQAAADGGDLDIVCGFQLLDDDCRMVVIEGLGEEGKGLATAMKGLKRQRRNDGGYRVLYHPKVRFTHRLYTCFNVDLKKIRLRYPLPTLMQMPDVYDRAKIPMEFFEALQSLLNLRKVGRLHQAKMYRLFPNKSILEQIESRYGETICKEDIWGAGGKEAMALSPSSLNKADSTTTPGSVAGAVSVGSRDHHPHPQMVPEAEEGTRRDRVDKRKASTHCWNPEYTQRLHHRQARDFLAERRVELIQALRNYYEQHRKREEEDAKDPVPARHQYGSQKLQYVELKKARMREELSRRGDAVFTYSHDFMGANFPMVDEFRIQQDAKAKNKALWKTKEGFIWPAPRRPEELNAHPQRPSQSRIDILKEPWIEKADPPKAVSHGFKAIASYSRLFGGYQKPKFDREYDSSKVGDPHRLPRGRMQLKSNPDFYSSVHLAGVENIKLQQETLRREKEEWLSKVVVDTMEFKPSRMVVKDRPSQVDRTSDILVGSPKKKAFKKVRNAHLPSGKPIKWETPPVNLFASEPFTDLVDFTLTFRGNAPAPSGGNPKQQGDFVLRLHRDRMKPRSQTIMCRRKHPEIPLEEKVGPKWET